VLLSTLAIVSASANPDLAEAEIQARSIIEACRETPSCGYDRRELAEAFVVRATAASILRGEVDPTAAANIERLAPGLALRWRSLLPDTTDVEPDPWVESFVEPADAPPAPSSPREVRRHSGPSMLRLAAAGGPNIDLEGFTGRFEAELRARIAGPLSVIARLSTGGTSHPVSREVLREFDSLPERVGTQLGTVTAGVALRATPSPASELFVYAGPLVHTLGVTRASFTAFEEEGLVFDPAQSGYGLTAGLIGIATLPGSRWLSLRGEIVGSSDRVATHGRYTSRYRAARSLGAPSVPTVTRTRSVQLGLDARARLDDRLLLFGGLEAERQFVDLGGLQFDDAFSVWRGPRLRFGTSVVL